MEKYTNNIEGWMSEEDLQYLYNTSKKMSSIIEIGSWKGRSTHALLSGCKNGIVYSVDPFTGNKEDNTLSDPDIIYSQFLQNVKSFSNLKSLKMTSEKAALLFNENSVDMIFIDANHSYASIKEDIDLWLPITRKVFCGHDYGYPDINKALFEKFKEVEIVDSIWVIDLRLLNTKYIKPSELFLDIGYCTDKYDLGYLTSFYDDLFPSFLSKKNFHLLEIGVQRGGSIKLWRDFFSETATIYAADINPFKPISKVIPVIGDSYSSEVIGTFSNDFFDVIIDDGPHTFESFTVLIKRYREKLKKNGIIVIEDITDPSWISPLISLAKSEGFSSVNCFDATGIQKTQELLEAWKNGLFVLILKR